jgi:hypothetical protein
MVCGSYHLLEETGVNHGKCECGCWVCGPRVSLGISMIPHSDSLVTTFKSPCVYVPITRCFVCLPRPADFSSIVHCSVRGDRTITDYLYYGWPAATPTQRKASRSAYSTPEDWWGPHRDYILVLQLAPGPTVPRWFTASKKGAGMYPKQHVNYVRCETSSSPRC